TDCGPTRANAQPTFWRCGSLCVLFATMEHQARAVGATQPRANERRTSLVLFEFHKRMPATCAITITGWAALLFPDLHPWDSGFRFRDRDVAQLLADAPDVALRVKDSVRAVAVELVPGFMDNDTPRRTSPFAMVVNSVS